MKPTAETSLQSRLEALLAQADLAGEVDSLHARILQTPSGDPIATRKYYFSPHSMEYISPLRPFFLGHLENPDVVGWLSPLLARDGLLSLAYFFHKMPSPPRGEEKSVVLVNQRFAPFVPEAWAEQVAYYSIRPSRATPSQAIREASEVYLILTAIDERQCSLDFLRARLTAIREALGERLPKVRLNVVSILRTTPTHEVSGAGLPKHYYFDCLMAIRDELGPNLHCLSWAQLEGRKLTDCVFLDLNEFDFYYSDSFLTQHLLGMGAIPFGFQDSAQDQDFWVNASLLHGYRICFERSSATMASKREDVREAMGFLQTDLYREEERAFESDPKAGFRDGLKFCPLSFETLIHSLARKFRI